jgi:hypothetical protein
MSVIDSFANFRTKVGFRMFLSHVLSYILWILLCQFFLLKTKPCIKFFWCFACPRNQAFLNNLFDVINAHQISGNQIHAVFVHVFKFSLNFGYIKIFFYVEFSGRQYARIWFFIILYIICMRFPKSTTVMIQKKSIRTKKVGIRSESEFESSCFQFPPETSWKSHSRTYRHASFNHELINSHGQFFGRCVIIITNFF